MSSQLIYHYTCDVCGTEAQTVVPDDGVGYGGSPTYYLPHGWKHGFDMDLCKGCRDNLVENCRANKKNRRKLFGGK